MLKGRWVSGFVSVVSVANGLFEQFDGWDFNHMFGEIGAELQGKSTDEDRILHQKCLYAKDDTEGPLPDCILARSPSMPMDRWQQRLALILGGKMIHALG